MSHEDLEDFIGSSIEIMSYNTSEEKTKLIEKGQWASSPKVGEHEYNGQLSDIRNKQDQLLKKLAAVAFAKKMSKEMAKEEEEATQRRKKEAEDFIE